LDRVGDSQLLLRLLADGDRVARLDGVRGDIDDLAVDRDRTVRDELARLGAGRAEAHAVADVVEPRLEQAEQVGAGVALPALGFRVCASLASVVVGRSDGGLELPLPLAGEGLGEVLLRCDGASAAGSRCAAPASRRRSN